MRNQLVTGPATTGWVPRERLARWSVGAADRLIRGAMYETIGYLIVLQDAEISHVRTAMAEVATDVVIVDEHGREVADQLIDPIREQDTPEEERYSVVLKRRDANGALPPVSFLFRSGEPALECRDRYRRFIGPHGRPMS